MPQYLLHARQLFAAHFAWSIIRFSVGLRPFSLALGVHVMHMIDINA